jgi:hypothetical protein
MNEYHHSWSHRRDPIRQASCKHKQSQVIHKETLRKKELVDELTDLLSIQQELS